MRTIDHVDILRSSEKFRAWRPEPSTKVDDLSTCMKSEEHYSPAEVAKLWGISADFVRDLFRNEPEVLALERTGSKKYATLRIPESVLERVHSRMTRT